MDIALFDDALDGAGRPWTGVRFPMGAPPICKVGTSDGGSGFSVVSRCAKTDFRPKMRIASLPTMILQGPLRFGEI